MIALPSVTWNFTAQISRIVDIGVIANYGNAQKPEHICSINKTNKIGKPYMITEHFTRALRRFMNT